MKEGMSSVDVAALATELSALLVGARVDKAYQPAKDQILLRFRKPAHGRLDVLFQLGRFLTVTRRPPDNPDQPSMVARILRQEFGNGRVTGVRQIGFDRLLRIDVQRGEGDRSLVFEIFGDGNLLLLDGTGTIFLPMRGAEHGARRLKKGEPYVPPPGPPSPLTMDRDTFTAAGRGGQRDIVRCLALDMGFGPMWAEELCLRAGVPKDRRAAQASDGEWAAVHDAVHALADDIGRNDLAPALVYEEGQRIDAVPFTMQAYPPPRFQVEEATTFREALDAFFCGVEDADEDREDPRQKRFDEARGRIERQLRQMEEAIAGFEVEEAERRADAETVYAHFADVDAVLASLRQAHEDRTWDEIAAVLAQARDEGDEAASRVAEIRGHEGKALLDLVDLERRPRRVEVDLRRNVQDNADALYEAAKKARSRAQGAAKAVAVARQQLADVDAKGLDAFGTAPTRTEAVRRHFWFETYRWTVLPDGFLAVGGRNAGQNDAVVKKYLRPNDRYVHADVHGAPSVVVRAADGSDRTPGDDVLRLAGQFAVCASRAWRQFAEASAYWVTAQQVSKTPRSGEFVPRGAWIVHGRRNGLDHLPIQWALARVAFGAGGAPLTPDAAAASEARVVEKLAGGPPEALRPYALRLRDVSPGATDPNDAAAALAEEEGIPMEEAQAALPPGPLALGPWRGDSLPGRHGPPQGDHPARQDAAAPDPEALR